ncbi:MAG: NAD(P)H-hydrate dehydratase [Syntrophothermus sp.]
MIPLYSTKEIRDVDNFAINELGMPGLLLMENASIEIRNAIYSFLSQLKLYEFGIICGKGNNGGDGFALARHLANDGHKVKVIFFGIPDDFSNDAKANYDILTNLSNFNNNIKIVKFKNEHDVNRFKDADVIIDAILGSGAKGELKEPYKSFIEKLNNLDKIKIAIDIPTGLDAETGYGETIFKADLTVTLGELKKGLFIENGYENCGEVVKGDIGIDDEYFAKSTTNEYLIEPEDAFEFLPVKEKNINKYSAGKVLVIAGSGKYPGAAALTSRATLRAGAGSCILAFPESSKKLLFKNILEVVVNTYEDEKKEYLSVNNIEELNKRIHWADCVIIGPGLGREDETKAAVKKILDERKFKNLLIDADGLFALNGIYKNYNLKNVVLTPHHKEFSNLLGIELGELKKDLIKYGREFANQTGSFLILKGAPTIIFNTNSEVFINTVGNPGMAKFGTGDVLSGITGSFIAQSSNIEEAIISSVYLHSLTADLLKNKYSENSYTANDIVEFLPKTFKFLRKSIV